MQTNVISKLVHEQTFEKQNISLNVESEKWEF